MNISRILSSLDECDRKFFQESIADTLTYLTEALDILPASAAKTAEVTRLRRFKIWLEMFDNNVSTYNDVQSARSDSDADEGKEMTISQMLKDQWDNEKLVGRGWY